MTAKEDGKNKLLKVRGALSEAIVKSAYLWQMATDERGVIQIFNVGAETMLGYDALEVVDRITTTDISDPRMLTVLKTIGLTPRARTHLRDRIAEKKPPQVATGCHGLTAGSTSSR